jgi:cytochrome c556
MMRATACFGILVLAGCAAAVAAPGAKAPAAGAVSPQQIVAVRQAAFGMSAVVFGSMRPVVESGGDVKPLTFGARNLAKWARALPGTFPSGSGTPESHAKPAVWANRADFERKAADYAAAAGKLAELAAANDKAGFAAQYKVVGGTCGACHDAYRAEQAH